MAPFQIPFCSKVPTASCETYLEKGNKLCSSRKALNDLLIEEIKEIYAKCKVILDGEQRRDTPLIFASRLELSHIVWGFIECARKTDTDLQTGNVGAFQQFMGHANWNDGTALQVAAVNSYVEVVDVLLQNVSLEQLISYRNKNKNTPLSLTSNLKIVKDVFAILGKAAEAELQLSSTIISMDYQLEAFKQEILKSTRLHHAAKFGDVMVVNALINEDPSQMYSRDENDETPAYIAAKEGHLDILRIMISYFREKHDNVQSLLMGTAAVGAIVRETEAVENALHSAICRHHLGVVFWLIKLVPNFVDERALYIAAEKGESEIVKLILEIHKVEIIPGQSKDTTLHAAARRGSTECIRYLVRSNRGLLYVEDEHHCTPIAEAVCFGNVAATEALLDFDGSIITQMAGRCQGQDGPISIPLTHLAVMINGPDVLELLISKCPGCMDFTSSTWGNILHLAVILANM